MIETSWRKTKTGSANPLAAGQEPTTARIKHTGPNGSRTHTTFTNFINHTTHVISQVLRDLELTECIQTISLRTNSTGTTPVQCSFGRASLPIVRFRLPVRHPEKTVRRRGVYPKGRSSTQTGQGGSPSNTTHSYPATTSAPTRSAACCFPNELCTQ